MNSFTHGVFWNTIMPNSFFLILKKLRLKRTSASAIPRLLTCKMTDNWIIWITFIHIHFTHSHIEICDMIITQKVPSVGNSKPRIM